MKPAWNYCIGVVGALGPIVAAHGNIITWALACMVSIGTLIYLYFQIDTKRVERRIKRIELEKLLKPGA